MKKYKLGIMGAAKFAFGTSLLGYFLSLFFLAMGCENSKVAGITVSYSGYVTSGHISLMSLGKLYNELLQLTRFSVPFVLPFFVSVFISGALRLLV